MNLISLAEQIEKLAGHLKKPSINDDISDYADSIYRESGLWPNRLLDPMTLVPVDVVDFKSGETLTRLDQVLPRDRELEGTLNKIGDALRELAVRRSEPRPDLYKIYLPKVRRLKISKLSADSIAKHLLEYSRVLKEKYEGMQISKVPIKANLSRNIGHEPISDEIWSRPMTKTEITRCYLGRAGHRTRKAIPWMKRHGIKACEGSKSLYIIRLDLITEQTTRDRFK